MSFYDDASLVFLPSGGAGKDGKAYSMKPVPEYGNELVTNGGFDTDSDWVKGTGWTISGGTANCDGTQTTNTLLYQNLGDLSNKTIRLTFTISGYSAGQLSTAFFGAAGTQVENVSANGTYTFDIDVQSGHNGNTGFTANSSFIGSVDNVSVKEVIVDGDFTFSRGSNLTATRVDSNGLIEKGRENLLKQSNNFGDTSAWIQSQTTRSSGQGGYDGTNDAWEITRSSGGGLALYQTITNNSGVNTALSGVNTFSIYVKINTSNGIGLAFGAKSVMAQFNISDALQTGAVVENGIILSTQEYIGNDFYRLSVTANTTASDVRLYALAASGTSVISTGATYIVQDAQTELGLVATEYIESGASTGKAGLLEHSPRFDYSGGASCPSLLLEPSRTNIVPISEGIPEDTNGVTLTENYGTSPEGVQNSLKVQKNGSSPSDRIYPIDNYNANLVSGTSYSVSAFVKNIDVNGTTTIACRVDGGTLFRLGYEWSGSSLTKVTDYSAGTRTNEILEDYGNGWWRIGFSFVADNTQGGVELDIDRDNGSATTSIETYGWQLEEGSYPTSYIPNHSGGSVTRAADVNTLLNQSGVIGQTAGTILFDAYFDEADKINLSISDSTSNNNILIDTTSGKQVFAVVQQGGSTQAAISTSGSFFTEGDRLKCAIAYDDRDMAFYINGTQVGTAAPNLIPACDDIKFSRWNGALAANQRVNRVVLFTTRLSNGNLATLTS